MLAHYLFCYLVTLLFCSIFCVQIEPKFEVIPIWNTDRKFVTCFMDRKEKKGRLEWYSPNGRPVGVSPLSTVYQVCKPNNEGGTKSCKLFFVRPYKVNSGIYVCKHFRDNGLVIEEEFEMKIFNTIDMTENVAKYISQEGGDLNMDCVVNFDSDITEAGVLWTHENNQLIADLSRYSIQSKTIEESLKHKLIKNTMTIKKVESGDAGIYICQAIYANEYLSDIKSIDVEVIVQYKPKFKKISPSNLIWINEKESEDKEFYLELKCRAEGDPLPKYGWYIGNQSLFDNLGAIPSFIEVLTKDNASILTIRLKNVNKFRHYIKELKDSSRNISCKASNNHGDDTLVFDFKFGKLPETPIINYFDPNRETGYITLEINYTQSDPPIEKFKLVLSNDYYIYFNNSFKDGIGIVTEQGQYHNHEKYIIPFNRNALSQVHSLDLLAQNPVGWSPPLNMPQDTTTTDPGLPDYKWQLSTFQISVLLFILLLLVVSTSVQVIYFNYCDQSGDES